MKEYLKNDYPSIDYIYDEILENEIGYEESFIFDGIKYKATVKHDGTFLEYGIKGSEVIFEQLNDQDEA